ncbi:hypothetical protein CK203_112296 [Vitis vinifera]|uniref:Uncharacterized protein n=1 Tax=Vitis vinifera TaxID=29760 RepID=A0A438CCJ9_VITVI|nr:hypothetical protein CK203_112296 [Vitis vinifera]
MFAHIPSLQLVTNLPDSNKGGAKGLFEITTIERHHQTLLSTQNLLAVVQEPQSYVLNILHRRLPKVVVLGEYFVLKDLPFHEKASEADVKAHQERLDQQEEKRGEGDMKDLKQGSWRGIESGCMRLSTLSLPQPKRFARRGPQEDLAEGAPPSTMPQQDKVGPSAAVATQPDAARPSTAAAVQLTQLPLAILLLQKRLAGWRRARMSRSLRELRMRRVV